MLTVRTQAVRDLIDDINATALQLGPVACYATPEAERDLRLAAETLDHALCVLQRARHEHTRSLLDEIEGEHH